MGHNIEYYDYKENVKRNEVLADLSNYVSHATWQEGGHGIEQIRWLEKDICASYDEAQKYIEAHDRKWYDCLAVRYYEPIREKNAKIDELTAKVTAAYKLYDERNSALYTKTRTSEFIGCSQCGSRLATKYLKMNHCPVCRGDLRPDTTLKSIAAAEAKYHRALKEKEEYIQKHSKKEVRWLVKIEYHT